VILADFNGAGAERNGAHSTEHAVRRLGASGAVWLRSGKLVRKRNHGRRMQMWGVRLRVALLGAALFCTGRSRSPTSAVKHALE